MPETGPSDLEPDDIPMCHHASLCFPLFMKAKHQCIMYAPDIVIQLICAMNVKHITSDFELA